MSRVLAMLTLSVVPVLHLDQILWTYVTVEIRSIHLSHTYSFLLPADIFALTSVRIGTEWYPSIMGMLFKNKNMTHKLLL